MNIIRYDQDAEDGIIKSVYVDSGKYRLLISFSHKNWYTRGKKRIIPIWISKKGLFIYRLAIRIGVIA